MTPTARAEIERLAREATAGPWEFQEISGDDGFGYINGSDGVELVHHGSGRKSQRENLANAAYIAAVSPDVVLGMIAEHRAALERAERQHKEDRLYITELTRRQCTALLEDPEGRSHSCHYLEREAEALAALRAAEAERDEIRDKCCGCLTPDEKDETIAELSAERDKLREALEQISKPRYGLDTNANVHEGLEYWENIALGYRKSARAALQSTSAKEGE